jgi:hypothetical protein
MIGIIYKLSCSCGKNYIGHSFNYPKRIKKHYKNYFNKYIGKNQKLYNHLNECNIGPLYFMKLNEYDVPKKKDIFIYENDYVLEYDSVMFGLNMIYPIKNKELKRATLLNYREVKKDAITKTHKLYRALNPMKVKQWEKNKRNKQDKSKVADYQVGYRKKNKDKIKQQKTEPYNCLCGHIIQRVEIRRHTHTKKHHNQLIKTLLLCPIYKIIL